MKKIILLVFVAVFSLTLVACSSLGKVKGVIEEEDYLIIDMEDSTEQSDVQNTLANILREEYTKFETLQLEDGNAKLHVWAMLPTSPIQLTNPDFAIVVEFSSRGALVKELSENAEFNSIVLGAIGEEVTEELVYQKGLAVDNCFIYAKGALSNNLYQAIVAK